MTASTLGPHGLLLLDKPAGITSHDLVARTRRALNTRKVGHAGTLDPMATGLMLLGIGDATRLLTYLVGEDKTYEATARLGIATNTEDAEGEVTATNAVDEVAAVSESEIRAAVASFHGPISQVPSAVSAIKIDGKRAYQRVREGEEVELPARDVVIPEIEVLGIDEVQLDDTGAPGTKVIDLQFRVRCSSGTYVRALARDIGARLGLGAHLTALRRTTIGPFRVRDVADLEDAALAEHLLSSADVARARFPHFTASAAEAAALRHGQRIAPPEALLAERGPIATLAPDGALIGIVEVRGGRTRTLMNLPHRPEDAA